MALFPQVLHRMLLHLDTYARHGMFPCHIRFFILFFSLFVHTCIEAVSIFREPGRLVFISNVQVDQADQGILGVVGSREDWSKYRAS